MPSQNLIVILLTLNKLKNKYLFCWRLASEKLNINFPDFEQAKSSVVTSLTLSKLKTPFKKTPWLTWCQPLHWSLCILVLPCYLEDAMQCQWSSSDLPRVLRIWESGFYSQVLFTSHSFLLVSRLPWSWQLNLKVSRASCWSSKHNPGPTICLTHSNSQNLSVYVSKASLKVRIPQPCNLPLTSFEPSFLKAPCVKNCYPWRLGHRVLWVLADGCSIVNKLIKTISIFLRNSK